MGFQSQWRVFLIPPVADGTKASILETDHICGIYGDQYWVWKAFTSGHNPIFMDGYDGADYGVGGQVLISTIRDGLACVLTWDAPSAIPTG